MKIMTEVDSRKGKTGENQYSRLIRHNMVKQEDCKGQSSYKGYQSLWNVSPCLELPLDQIYNKKKIEEVNKLEEGQGGTKERVMD